MTSPARSSTTSAPESSPSARARCSPGCCWRTRSTGRPRRPSRPCSRRCRSGRSPSRARRSCSPALRRPRDRQPGRVRRHLPLARGAARPVPDAGQLRLPERRGGGRGAATPAGAAAGRADAQRDDRRRPPSLAMQRRDRDGHGRPTISRYCVDLARPRATHEHVMVGASPRGALGLLLAARSLAVIHGRDYVIARGRQGGGSPGPRPPPDPETRAVDDRGHCAQSVVDAVWDGPCAFGPRTV